MHLSSENNPNKKGFLLLEVVLALSVFAIACTGLTVAFHKMGEAASLAQEELRVTRMVNSTLYEYLSFPNLEEGTTQTTIEGTDIKIDVNVEMIEDLENQEGVRLQQMYHIKVIANWFEAGEWHSRSAETWRYNPMYQP